VMGCSVVWIANGKSILHVGQFVVLASERTFGPGELHKPHIHTSLYPIHSASGIQEDPPTCFGNERSGN
jgi:hypothetical protein